LPRKLLKDLIDKDIHTNDLQTDTNGMLKKVYNVEMKKVSFDECDKIIKNTQTTV